MVIFLITFFSLKQEEHLDQEEIAELVRKFEPDPAMRSHCFMSFEGFARMLMDKNNYAHAHEKSCHDDEVSLMILSSNFLRLIH